MKLTVLILTLSGFRKLTLSALRTVDALKKLSHKAFRVVNAFKHQRFNIPEITIYWFILNFPMITFSVIKKTRKKRDIRLIATVLAKILQLYFLTFDINLKSFVFIWSESYVS